MSKRLQLQDLLTGAGGGTLIQRCCVALEYPSTLYKIGEVGLRIEQARYVNHTRGLINQERGKLISGYTDLLPTLDALDAETVRLHAAPRRPGSKPTGVVGAYPMPMSAGILGAG